jgi:hypothetical protein
MPRTRIFRFIALAFDGGWAHSLRVVNGSPTSMFELAFWVLYFCKKLLQNARLPPETKERMRGCRYAILYTSHQIRDVLNAPYALIMILRNSDVPVPLNRIGGNPLGHAFGKVRLRCRDIHTMKNFMSGLTAKFLNLYGEILSSSLLWQDGEC